tara:strand:- start:83 stop:694 length:612 start_codon:yes stop_codon:yes gene_type:complete
MTSEIIKQSTELLTEQFTNGEGLRGVPLKNYSGPKLEEWSENTLKLIIKDLQNKYPNSNIEWGKGYLKSDQEGLGDERLDQHVKIDGVYVYLQEDRAWVDKPFYTLKRAVIRNIMISCKQQLHPNVKFGLVGYCIDIKQDLVNTCNVTQGFADKVSRFSLTGRRRSKKVNGKTVNWYETGFVEETVVQYINYVYKTLEDVIVG